MNEADVYPGLAEIFADVFMRDDIAITPQLSAKDVKGWDSYRQIEIIMAAEEKYGIKFHTRELDSLKNVGDLARVIAAKA